MNSRLGSLLLLAAGLGTQSFAHAASLNLHARYRTADSPDAVVQTNLNWDATSTAIVVCDMWNQHWCQGATRRVAEMAPRMNAVIEAARARGVLVIHCPSSTLKFYESTPQRALAKSAPKAEPRVPLQNWCHLDKAREGALPIDDSDGGCDDEPQCPQGSPWTRQIETIRIAEGDAITDSAEAYNLMQARGIENVIVMGVHVNMCVLGRPFSIRQMVYQGKNVVLMRDLTDAMYNSRKAPYVPHCRGTELVVEHIETHWCPSITSVDFIGGEPFRFAEDRRPRVLFMIGEKEYRTSETLPAFARAELSFRGFDSSFVHANENDPNHFPGLVEALAEADVLVLSVRRRTPENNVLDAIRSYLARGKPLVAIRTASHAFGATPSDDQHSAWPSFDQEILGGHYQGHYSNKPPKDPATVVRPPATAEDHPLLRGWPNAPLNFTSHLYKNRQLAPTTTTLLIGNIAGQDDQMEPVAWINTAQDRRVFYTALGSPEDFQQPAFRRLLLNGILWAVHRPIPPADMPLQVMAAVPAP